MAGDPANSSRNAAKWGLVAALGFVLVAVVAWQLFSGAAARKPTEAAEKAQREERPSRRLPRKFPTQGAPLNPSSSKPLQWPAMALKQAIAHDPFAPEVVPGTATASGASVDEAQRAAEAEHAAMLAETLEALRERGVSMVLQTTHGPVATIGDRTIKVGDTVGDYRVTEIDADGVVLEPTPPK